MNGGVLWGRPRLGRCCSAMYGMEFKKFFMSFYTREINTESTTSRHLPLSYVISIQSTLSSYLLKSHLSIISPSTLRVFNCSLSLLSLSGPRRTSLPHTCHKLRPSYSCSCVHPNNICWGIQITKLLVIPSSLIPCYLELECIYCLTQLSSGYI